MIVYTYNTQTMQYEGPRKAYPSPLEPGEWLIPAHATTTAPPPAMSGKVRVWRGEWQFEDVQADQPLDPEYEPSLGEVKAAKLTRINDAKNTHLDGGFLHNGVLFDSDSKARLAYLELSLKLGQDPEYSTPWKASTGQWVTMDAALFAALQPAYESHISACFAWQAAREMEVAAAQTAAAVQAIADTI